MRPIFPASRSDRCCGTCAGFTLLEMVAVMLIVALVAGLVVTLTPGSGRAQLKSTALDAASLLRRERQGAVLTGHMRAVSLDPERRVLVGDGGRTVAIPRDIVLDVMGADAAAWSGQRAVVRFHPDGASSGAVMRLSREGAAYEIRVNWYTGGVAVEAR
jgi:general secretion pathway protein H